MVHLANFHLHRGIKHTTSNILHGIATSYANGKVASHWRFNRRTSAHKRSHIVNCHQNMWPSEYVTSLLHVWNGLTHQPNHLRWLICPCHILKKDSHRSGQQLGLCIRRHILHVNGIGLIAVFDFQIICAILMFVLAASEPFPLKESPLCVPC